MTMPTLFLIRHGETAWSKTGQHTGQTDIPLTSDGEAMARELKPLLAPIKYSTVLASPRLRAVQTSALALPGRRVTIDPDLAEWDYGAYEGLTTATIRTSRPDWNIFRDGCPDGETLAQVVARADRIVARVQVMDGNLAHFLSRAIWLCLGGALAATCRVGRRVFRAGSGLAQRAGAEARSSRCAGDYPVESGTVVTARVSQPRMNTV